MIARSVLLTAVLVLGLAAPAVAEDKEEEARAACTSDYQKFCSSVIPGGGRIQSCLQKNADKLDASCKSFLDANSGAQTKN